MDVWVDVMWREANVRELTAFDKEEASMQWTQAWIDKRSGVEPLIEPALGRQDGFV